ncbi:hypothetical protein AHIS1636_27360 [Arthrobacter mangrovi]|uniref:Coenzyme F420 hydrogenase n=2 Tax=Arthrobacter mangrovi TaxID=2966350 RepID=A0ABQ5MWG8_9MICC|nr:hypothetical protein AHIS1636_27360 [Arthrobacter mangrovi]
MTSWTAAQLLARGLVDGVIHVGAASPGQGELFTYQVSYNLADIQLKRKSAYYSTTMADALAQIRGDGRSYAVIGVPCFIRAARLVGEEDPVLGKQLKYHLGLVCGHLKSQWFAESMAWQAGVKPDALESVDFRVKAKHRSSNDYDFGAKGTDDSYLSTKPTQALVGGNWGHGMFQLNACNYCDDIFAETADVVFGDAWLPEYKSDSRGTNVVISRNENLNTIFAEGQAQGILRLDELPADRVAASQAGNFRHRRIGLAVRLADDIREGKSVPLKRIAPGIEGVSARRLDLIRLRRKMSEKSLQSFESAKMENNINVFLKTMLPLVRKYRNVEFGGAHKRILTDYKSRLKWALASLRR